MAADPPTPLDRYAQRLLRMIALSRGGEAGSPETRRRGLEALKALAEDPADDAVSSRDMIIDSPGGPLPVRLYDPGTPDAVSGGLVYFHGGGWVAGDLETHDGLCRRLAMAARIKILAVDYRRSPEHRFPAPVEDGIAALQWAADHAGDLAIDPSRLGIGGDSAGAGIAAAVALTLVGRLSLAVQLLICPILDLAAESASRRAYAEGYFLDRATMDADLADYLGQHTDLADPRLSPLRTASLAGAPPALIHTASHDPFRDEAAAFSQALRQAGATTQITDHAGMIHYFYALPRAIPYAREAARMIGAELAAALG